MSIKPTEKLEEVEQEIMFLLAEFRQTGDGSRVVNVLEAVDKSIEEALSAQRQSFIELVEKMDTMSVTNIYKPDVKGSWINREDLLKEIKGE